MALKMKPIIDQNGFARPDLDYRDVPVSIMAFYLNVAPSTVWKRLVAGFIPSKAVRAMGRVTYYKPRVVMGIDS